MRAIVVASATPFTPILGSPSHPKMNTQLRRIFKRSADTVIAVTVFTCSTLLITV